MFEYKKAKQKSNYLRLKFPIGGDLVSGAGNFSSQQAECTLVLPLFGEQQLTSVIYDLGRLNGASLLGKFQLPDTFANGMLKACSYAYQPKGDYLELLHFTQPYFKLIKESTEKKQAPEVLMTISSDKNIETFSQLNAVWSSDFDTQIKNQLCDIMVPNPNIGEENLNGYNTAC